MATVEINALTCASISISIVTAVTGFVDSLHSQKEGRSFIRFLSLEPGFKSLQFQQRQQAVVM